MALSWPHRLMQRSAAYPVDQAYHRPNRQESKLMGQMHVRVRYCDRSGPWLDFLFASKSEIEHTVKDAGWQVSHFIDGQAGSFAVVLKKG